MDTVWFKSMFTCYVQKLIKFLSYWMKDDILAMFLEDSKLNDNILQEKIAYIGYDCAVFNQSNNNE